MDTHPPRYNRRCVSTSSLQLVLYLNLILVPAWLTNQGWSQAQLISIIQDYVSTVASNYQGRVYAWDVVSEIFNDNGA